MGGARRAPDRELALAGEDTAAADRVRRLLDALTATTPGAVAHVPVRPDAGTR